MVVNGVFKSGGIWADNVWYDRTRGAGADFAGMTFDKWTKVRHETGSVLADPKFVDAGSFDFRLLPDSPALKSGFRPIDTSKVGPQ